jgi:hypothetical protein
MVNLSTTSYGSCLQKMAHLPADFSEEHVVQQKVAAIHNDPFAMELAFRLAIADLSHLLGESFRASYSNYGGESNSAGEAWIHLTIICVEDKILGQGRTDSIVSHPLLGEVPALRDISAARKDQRIVQVARRFQAAYETMNTFDTRKPHDRGISSFDRKLERISEPEPLWIVLAGLKRVLVKSPIEMQ